MHSQIHDSLCVNDFSERVADTKSIEILNIATALDPQYKNLKRLSHYAKEQTWSLIGQQIASDDWIMTNAQDDTDGVNKTICEPNEKRFKLMLLLLARLINRLVEVFCGFGRRSP